MIKSLMSYVDVVFPVTLGPLTYRCPAELEQTAEPGMIVSAPLRKKMTKGVLWATGSEPPEGAVKEVAEIHGDSPALGKGLMKLLRWMADYYLAPEGTVLKQTLPREVFAMKTATERSSRRSLQSFPLELPAVPEEDISDITGTLSEKRYHTFLVHAPSSTYEYSLVRALLGTGLRNILVILPEISRANTLAGALADRFRDRLCVLHAGITGGRRSEYIRRILAGTHDVVVGTGLALFAPMPNISVIMVLREHGSSYKREEGIRFNIRDAAVMRGYMERCKVMLTSISPSVDSYFNALSGKYSFIRPRMRAERPKIRTVDMKFEKKASPGISKTALDISRSRLSLGKRVMFVINRRGHSTLFLCEDCGHTERCPSCDIPLVLHKKEKVLKCHYCGVSRDIPGKCEKCGGHRLRLAGYGTQKVQEEIEVLLGAEALRFDSDEVKKRSEVAEILRSISKDSTKVVVGTRMMTKRLEIEKFGLAVVLNIDASLNIPDFRSSEKTYMELASIGELLGPGGQMVIQTRFPGTPVFRYLREGDYLSFVREELAVRKNMHYPPYSRLLQITFSGGVDVPRAEELVLRAGKNVEVLGPVIDKDRKGEERVTFLLKSGDKRLLRAAAKKITGITRNVRGPKVVIDVDPV